MNLDITLDQMDVDPNKTIEVKQKLFTPPKSQISKRTFVSLRPSPKENAHHDAPINHMNIDIQEPTKV